MKNVFIIALALVLGAVWGAWNERTNAKMDAAHQCAVEMMRLHKAPQSMFEQFFNDCL